MRINIELNETKKFNKHYTFCVGSGHAPLALRKDYTEQLKFVHDTLGIERVRFHGIFNDDMTVVNKYSDILPVIGADRFVEYNFMNIAIAYDNVLSAGMKPFVELSFMPKHLAAHKEQNVLFYYGGNSGMPRIDSEWQDFIKSFINFLIKRYGREEVETWFFEVWNEPDLLIFFGGSKEDYFHLYEITVRAIKEVDENIKVGGPSTSGSKWIPDFIRFVKENDVPCDFISTHQYAGDPIGSIDGMHIDKEEEEWNNPFSNPDILKGCEGSILDAHRFVMPDKSETEEIRNDTIIINSRQVKNVIGDLPLYYTEWSENAIFSASTNDTRKVAAFLVMTALKTEDIMDGSSVWCFSDIFEEFHTYKEEFHGGFGLLSHNGIPKPSYYAMRFLNDIGEERFQISDTYGDITMAAFKKDNTISLLITRQYMRNQDLKKERIELVLNIDAKAATIESINEESGNPLKYYHELENNDFLTPKEVEYIKKNSKVERLPMEYEKGEGNTSFELEVGVNDVYLVKFVI